MKSADSEIAESSRAKVLLTDTNRWDLAARIAIGLNEAGCQVAAVCPAKGHSLLKARAVKKTFSYSGLRPIESLKAAIEAANPDIVVPACDRSVEHLHELYFQEKSRGEASSRLTALIERSLGPPESYSIVSSRNDLLSMAREEGVRVPNLTRINSMEDLRTWKMREPFPWVIKADGTWGGAGVRIVNSVDQAEKACSELGQISRFSRAMKRLIVNRDPFLLRPWWNKSERKLVVQSFVHGRPGNCTVFAWKGKVLALIAVEVVRSDGATGPASIVRIVDNKEMRFAAERVAARLELSGFFGLDFMIENGTHAVYLIEMNPRLAPPCYLRLGKGSDLPGALWAQLAGKPLPDHQAVTQNEMIAYLPQALKGNQDMLPNCFKELPEGEPEFVQELLHPYPDRTILFRLVQWLSRTPGQGEFETAVSPAPEDVASRKATCELRVDEELGIKPLLRKVGDRPE